MNESENVCRIRPTRGSPTRVETRSSTYDNTPKATKNTQHLSQILKPWRPRYKRNARSPLSARHTVNTLSHYVNQSISASHKLSSVRRWDIVFW